MDAVLQQLVQGLVIALLGILTYAVARLSILARVWIEAKVADLEARVEPSQLYLIKMVVEFFVKAAEQMGLSGQISDAGAAKKSWVIARVQAFCNDRGLPVDVATIEAMLEAAIRDGIHKGSDGTTTLLAGRAI